MSIEQGASFAKGLKDILEKNKEARKERTADYAETIKAIGEDVAEEFKAFQSESEDYAIDMVTMNDQLNKDIQALYKSIYGEGDEEEEGT
jgi:predicted trehalose synthase